MSKITLVTHKQIEKATCGVVRISEEAEAVIHQLQLETGLSARCIVSQIILQGADLVEVVDARKIGGNK